MKNKELVYVSFENAENLSSGVNKKIVGQIGVFNNNGFHTTLVAVYGESIAVMDVLDQEPSVISTSGKGKTGQRQALCDWVAGHASEFDCAYIRFQFFCPFVYQMVKSLHHSQARVIMEIPTYPYEAELKKQGLSGLPKLLCDKIFRGPCAKYIDAFAIVLYEKEKLLGRPCVELRNGIDVDHVTERKITVYEDGTIHLLAVAMMAPWHGYDRVIEGLGRYYQQGGKRNVIFHLVGEGAETANYERLVAAYSLQNKVIFHGKLHGDKLDNIYNQCDIGIACLGSHRTGVKRMNALKTLEYLAKGLPIVCEKGEVGISQDNPYRMTIPFDDSPLDVEDLVKFYDSVYTDFRHKEKTSMAIRKICRETCNIENAMSSVLAILRDKSK